MRTIVVPLAVGQLAPDFPLGGPPHDDRLTTLRGEPVVLVFSPTAWDPAREELTTDYADWYRSTESVRVLAVDRTAVAEAYGVTGAGLFVIDKEGVITWRYVPGFDAVPMTISADQPAGPPFAPDQLEPRRVGDWTRREFVQAACAVAALLTVALLAPPQLAANPVEEPVSPVSDPRTVTLTVNGRPVALVVEPRVTLLDALRNYAGMTGTKKGCDHGQCGACTVHVDGRRVLSCMTFAVMQQDKSITTIEGLASGDTLHPMQQAFISHDGFQCGYCTSGQIMSAIAVVKEPWGASDDDLREAMSGNICRCGAYPGIVAAIQSQRRQEPPGGRQ